MSSIFIKWLKIILIQLSGQTVEVMEVYQSKRVMTIILLALICIFSWRVCFMSIIIISL